MEERNLSNLKIEYNPSTPPNFQYFPMEVALDTETDGVNLLKAELITAAIYYPTIHTTHIHPRASITGDLFEYLKLLLQKAQVVGHNLPFDARVLMRLNQSLRIKNPFDTYLLASQYQCKPLSLKSLCIQFGVAGALPKDLSSYQSLLSQVFNKTGAEIEAALATEEGQKEFNLEKIDIANTPIALKYVGADPYLAYALKEKFKELSSAQQNAESILSKFEASVDHPI